MVQGAARARRAKPQQTMRLKDRIEGMATTDNETGKKPLTLSRPGRLEIKKTVEGGQVKQSFSHGRSKTVTVEVKKKRTFTQDSGGEMTEVKKPLVMPTEPEPEPVATGEPAVAKPEAEARPRARTLTEAERAARVRAVEEARRNAEMAARAQAENSGEDEKAVAQLAREAAAAAEAAERRRIERDEEQRRSEETARLEAEAEAVRIAEEATQRAAEAERRRLDVEIPEPAGDDEEGARPRARGGASKAPAAPAKAPARQRTDARRRSGKLTISEALDEESGARQRSLAAFRRRQERERQKSQQSAGGGGSQRVVREVLIPDAITVGELASRMATRSGEVIKTLMRLGVMATINQTIDQETAQLVVDEFGHRSKLVSAADVEIGLGSAVPDDEGTQQARAPVVTVMGHVDHGKTSLLDALRKTDVVSREAGGITQHIGAYQVTLESGEQVTFLDTPGHAAFTSMRQRGAMVTDIVILVVAADDGVQPQTAEAINHARAAGVPIIVAINKCDLPAADPNRVLTELLSYELVPEQMGGDIQCIEVSALTGDGLDKLVEALVLQAEIMELKVNPDRTAFGTIVEAKLERGRGAVATVLIQGGTLRIGDVFVAGVETGRVRALIDDRGENVESAGPSMPVEVLGFASAPQAGDDFAVVDNESRAREIAAYRQQQIREKLAVSGARGTLDEMFSRIAAGEAEQVPIIVKADVQGSTEAIIGALENLSTDEVKVQVMHSGVGGITESDVSLAAASGGIIIGFNVRAIAQARDQAKRDNVDIRYYNVIYNVVDDVRTLLEGKLSPAIEETHLGTAEVREVFNVSRVGRVAGCRVTDGVVRRGARVRLLRDSVVVYEGGLDTLKHFKDDAREITNGNECGISLENFNDVQQGDLIECFEVKEVARQL
jgi:translation initiation factor IF-2